MAALRLESPELSFVDGSLKIGQFARAPIRVYPGFLVAAGVLTVPNWWLRPGLSGIGLFAIGFATVFVAVMVHELAHAVVARRCGVTAARIDLYIFGGVVAFDTPPRTMWSDFAIVIAGPLSNLALAVMAYALLTVLNGGPPDLIAHGPLRSDVIFEARIAERALTFALYLNLGLFVVNTLPAFPLDGGKLLYLLIARRWDRRTATLVVAKLGVLLAFASYILLLVTAVVGCPIWSPPGAQVNLEALLAAERDGVPYY
jgi:membrane-associated protease RseP (regulator of RpoE activity)